MANCKFSPREFIQRSFSPMIAVFCSDAVNKICQKNNLSLTQLLQPFCTLDKEGKHPVHVLLSPFILT